MKNKIFSKAISYLLVGLMIFQSAGNSAYAAEKGQQDIAKVVTEEVTEESASETVSGEDSKERVSEETSEEAVSEEDSKEAVSESACEEESREDASEAVSEEESREDASEAVSEEESFSEECSTDETTCEQETTEEETLEETTEALETLESDGDCLETNADGLTYSPESDFEWNGNMITKYIGEATEVVLPERVTDIGESAFSGKGITSIILPEGLKTIGSHAFVECKSLEKITIPSEVTSIGWRAFFSCSSLQSVTIETAKLTSVGIEAFSGCFIKDIQLTDEMTYIPENMFQSAGMQSGTVVKIPFKVSVIGNSAFDGARNLSEVIFEGTSITDIGGAAFRGTGISHIALPEGLKTIGSHAFVECKSLEKITIPSEVTSIGWRAFFSCSSLQSVTIETAKLTSVGIEAFSGCFIKDIQLTDGMTYIPENMFQSAGMQSGTVVKIPSKVSVIGNSAFDGARNLSEVIFEGTGITDIGGAAFRGTGISHIALPEGLKTIGSHAFVECKSLEKITIPSEVTSIGWRAFFSCSSLQSVTIETAKLTSVGIEAFSGCFIKDIQLTDEMTYIPENMFQSAGMQSGTVVKIPSKVSVVGNSAFDGARNLSEVIFEGTGITDIGGAAFRGTGISHIALPEGLKTIGSHAFVECKSLEKITIPSEVTSIGWRAFFSCSSLQSVTIETAKLTSVGIEAFSGCFIKDIQLTDEMTYIPENMFQSAGMQSGTVVKIPSKVSVIGNSAFDGARNLSEVIFEGTGITDIGGAAFRGTGISHIALPEGLKTIGSHAFVECKNLEEITIPSKVTSIGWRAFFNCMSLTKAVLPKSLKSIESEAFVNVSNIFKIYAPKGSYAYNWAKTNGYTLSEYFTITYVLNGGINASGNPTVYEKGDSLTFHEPTRKGYEFLGWYRDAKCKNAFSYTAGTTGNLKVYAKWKAISYSITYHLNGGNNAKGNPQTYSATKAVTLKNPTKQGYTFAGWYLDEEYNTVIKTIKKGTAGDLNLYARWENSIYTIKFSPNGSKVTGGSLAPITGCGYEQEIILPKAPYARAGYTFVGWNTKKNGKGTAYLDEATVSRLTATNKGTVTLYAQWEAIPYAITYELNGGTNHAANPAYHTVVKSITLKNPTRTGYTFKGWYTDEACTKKISVISKNKLEPVTVYAKWKMNQYSITFNKNGGTGKMTALSNCEYESEIQLPAVGFTRNGYEFTGWNTKKNGTGISYEDQQTVKQLVAKNKGNITLYAQWKKK